jgi:hypothetical protein
LKKIGRSKCRQQIVECECDCGNKINTLLSRVKKGICKSCGCLKKEHDNNRKGGNNPNYKPHITEEFRKKNRFIPGYNEWNQKVKKRDNFVCRICEKGKPLKMVSHHLDGYHWCEEKRLDIDNGVCLCKECHEKFHKIYKKFNNTRQQFEEFIIKEKHE